MLTKKEKRRLKSVAFAQRACRLRALARCPRAHARCLGAAGFVLPDDASKQRFSLLGLETSLEEPKGAAAAAAPAPKVSSRAIKKLV